MGFYSTMESPESVSRVTPPTTTMANTKAQQTSNQIATGFCISISEIILPAIDVVGLVPILSASRTHAYRAVFFLWLNQFQA